MAALFGRAASARNRRLTDSDTKRRVNDHGQKLVFDGRQFEDRNGGKDR